MSAPTLERPTVAVRQHQDLIQVAGILDRQDQHGFLRTTGYLPGPEDVFVPPDLIRRHGLRSGDVIEGAATQSSPATSAKSAKPAKSARSANSSKARPLVRVDAVNGRPSDESAARPHFAAMTPIHPQERLRLAGDTSRVSTRIIDLIAPIGKGQRGLIVAPPKTGKTMLLQAIAAGVTANHPECHLMVVLLDERPEEVTDMRRTVDGEVLASTFDRPIHEHIAIAELAVERAKRLAEQGQDVVILLDSITRLCRAHNNNAKSSGRTLSGGVDASAVAAPKKLFGAARNLEEGGSVTILATALVDTGSRADDYFFEELKSTGSMELRLDRSLADKRVFPALDVAASGTRREELLMPPAELDAVRKLRRVLTARTNQQAVELLLEGAKQNAGNSEFLWRITHSSSSAS
ncbi:transcription termination factor Rho [Catenulispora acidiphila DSM 44928]|uniref:Transcription termination factor Rho n=1 Tax=Catenulispora acidiphila (strain DSM 44928 / JCM 14897 / NBRC 102108 / NRRL B-24433 / ID139908) TaxID=479433 RepID=C7PXM5_CATAD|nr:transcription termination factor Rho [Catenulispora acidiphila]ACU71478.1 transcription termination factor Rho [Catenulispora acidiphila DSM 44928]